MPNQLKGVLYLPSLIGCIEIVSVGSSSIVQFGDSIQLSPNSNSKTYAGAGSFLTGDLANTNNAISTTNTNDSDVVDFSTNQIG